MNSTIGPSDEQIDRIHERVQKHILADLSRRPVVTRRRRRPGRRLALIAASGGAIAAALVITGVIVPQGPGHGASAQAAEILTNAARTTITTSDPVVGTGQFLQIVTNSTYTSTIFNKTGPDTYYLVPTTGTLYIPADRTGQWVWVRHNLPITTVFGTSTQKAQVKLGAPTYDPNTEGTFRADGGAFYGTPVRDDHLDAQPRDPEALLKYFQKRYTGEPSHENQEIWAEITDELRTGQVPSDLRGALYKTAALIPGISVEGTDVTLDGRTGIAIGLDNSKVRDDIIIDPKTGLMIGERTVALSPSPGVPAGTSIAWTSITTKVVSSAP